MLSAAVLCFAPAGAGASFFHPWLGQREDLTVLPVELPGREKRFAEPECTELGALMDAVLPALRSATAGFDKVAVLGHSFGALLAYEATRALAAERDGLTLVASGATWPGTLRRGRITGLADDEFIAGIHTIAGYRHPALDEPELRDLVLPPLRTDVAMHENYAYVEREPLDVPVLAVRGDADRLVSADDLTEWERVTTGTVTVAELTGAHMYLVEEWPALLDLLAGQLLGDGTPS
ncbi:thioesterase [Streptomyces sp. CB01635]|uniref:thioesterase II family protein n=1 Tax=unclassified Streptomyces TaxID=2593676 RepID=UPI000C2782F7|nr:alpha/beta fold hydrolase [Streptomyces sp. CB01635]PJN08542.1 thioesterase [Streptomyces sp. CB01635]